MAILQHFTVVWLENLILMLYISILINFARVLASEGLDIESTRMKQGNTQSVKTVKFGSHMHCDKTYYISMSFNSNTSHNFGDAV